ncbi:hypothetical protein PQR57_39400 [Paraburkholderia dipogonis]|uniref:Uncharacterized protein n=1 Tax=Paraburkholderia dipogonis TaxID=1211383 RepID=A0ABW9B3T9_9BURK
MELFAFFAVAGRRISRRPPLKKREFRAFAATAIRTATANVGLRQSKFEVAKSALAAPTLSALSGQLEEHPLQHIRTMRLTNECAERNLQAISERPQSYRKDSNTPLHFATFA